jgi:hypothetical protein
MDPLKFNLKVTVCCYQRGLIVKFTYQQQQFKICKRTYFLSNSLLLGWMVWGSNPSGGESFRTHPDWPCGPPSLLYNRNRVFPGGKAAEASSVGKHESGGKGDGTFGLLDFTMLIYI